MTVLRKKNEGNMTEKERVGDLISHLTYLQGKVTNIEINSVILVYGTSEKNKN
jgi:hypothetical protein